MIEIKINQAHLNTALQRLASSLANPRPLMPVLAGILHHAVMENFDKQGRPAWAGLKPATIREKTRRGYGNKILVRRGGGQSLLSSITQQSDAHSASVGTNIVYGAIHQFGGQIAIAARSQRAYFKQAKDGSVGNRFVPKSQSNFAQWHTRGAHTVAMPARPFLQLTDTDEQKIVSKVSEYLRSVVGA